MKILLIHNYYQISGGEDESFRNDSEALKELGHDIVLFSRDNKEIDAYNPFEKFMFLFRIVYSYSIKNQLKIIIQKEKPDIAIVQNVFPLLSPSVYDVLFESKIPIFQSIRNFRFFCINSYFYDRGKICELCPAKSMIYSVIKKCYHNSFILSFLYFLSIYTMKRKGVANKISRFIVLNDFIRDKFVSYGLNRSKVSIRYNYIEKYTGNISEDKSPYILFMGTFIKQKGIYTIIESLGHLRKNEVVLKMAGDGPEKQSLNLLIKKLKIPNVELTGYLSGEEKQKVLSGCLFLIFPSEWYENFPRAILEAYSMGKSVIATDLGWMPKLVRHNINGLIYRAGDSRALAECIKYLIENPDARFKMGLHNFNECRNKYNKQNSLKALNEILLRTLNG